VRLRYPCVRTHVDSGTLHTLAPARLRRVRLAVLAARGPVPTGGRRWRHRGSGLYRLHLRRSEAAAELIGRHVLFHVSPAAAARDGKHIIALRTEHTAAESASRAGITWSQERYSRLHLLS